MRQRSVEQSIRHSREARVNDGSLPLHQHDVGALGAFEHELFGRARDEVGGDRIDADAASLDENSRLASRGEMRADAARTQRAEKLKLRRHLADVRIGTDGEHDGGADIPDQTVRNREPFWWATKIVNQDVVCFREGRQLGDVADERVQPAPDLEPVLDRSGEEREPRFRQLASHRGNPDDECVRIEGQPFFECADYGNIAAKAEHLLCSPARLARVDDADDALRREPNAGVRGLGCLGAEEALGQNEVTPVAGHCGTRRERECVW